MITFSLLKSELYERRVCGQDRTEQRDSNEAAAAGALLHEWVAKYTDAAAGIFFGLLHFPPKLIMSRL